MSKFIKYVKFSLKKKKFFKTSPKEFVNCSPKSEISAEQKVQITKKKQIFKYIHQDSISSNFHKTYLKSCQNIPK
jgi:hypothetical protein